MKQPRRWIAEKIERLDPERDYEAMLALLEPSVAPRVGGGGPR